MTRKAQRYARKNTYLLQKCNSEDMEQKWCMTDSELRAGLQQMLFAEDLGHKWADCEGTDELNCAAIT